MGLLFERGAAPRINRDFTTAGQPSFSVGLSAEPRPSPNNRSLPWVSAPNVGLSSTTRVFPVG